MYCKLYIHSNSIEAIILALEDIFGLSEKNVISTYAFKDFEVHITKNDEKDIEKIHIYPDGFLFYEYIADIEIKKDYIQITDLILRKLWKNQMPTVCACDYENELNAYVLES